MKKLLMIFIILIVVCCGGEARDAPIVILPIPLTWQPPQTPGLHLIVDQSNRREIFSIIRTADGLMFGDYGLDSGGSTIQTWDGKTLMIDGLFPEVESVFDLYMPEDGMALLTNEHYANIRKRISPGVWETKYKKNSPMDLMFYIRRAGNSLYANWITYGGGQGGIVRGDLNGNNWTDIVSYNDKALTGMWSDGSNIYLAGSTGHNPGAGYPILTDISGKILSGRPDSPNHKYWGGCKFGNLFVLGTSSYASSGGAVSYPGHIDVFDGVKNTTVWTNERTVIDKIEVYENKIYAVVTWDWTSDRNKTTLLMSSPDGYNWSLVCEIPCPHIIGTRFADGGVYLVGGRYRDYGRVYFYKF